MTQEGRQLANEWRGIMQAMLSRVEEVLTTQELEQFTVLILKVARAFQDNGSLKPQEKKASSRKITIEE
ncbi:hypothetical protein [Paenibacillus sp. V4I7]|uniref:hypothetical protein n=1 Tax=Paenibacillus sp. V4I7 TaxID=3042307 RepID=UPI00277F8FE1|nr:hypothetical protein [Paenibacillus sp. V4I7]MDQ0899128.1 enoyl reductase-like protein [Paenibacillus sp. V4I7]